MIKNFWNRILRIASNFNKRKYDSKYTRKGSSFFVYLVGLILLVIVSRFPLGYSIKNNKAIDINFAEGNKTYDEIMVSRTYTEQYRVTTTENLRLNSLRLFYNAVDKNFRGILTASIKDENGVVDSSSTELASTGSDGLFSSAMLEFGVNAQLLEGHEYTINLQINTNMPYYYVRKFCVQDQEYSNIKCKLITEESMVSNITYTPIDIMRYGDAFYGFIILGIIVSGLYVLKMIDINPMNNEYISRVLCSIQKHYNEIILILMFIYLALYEFYYAYVKETYISVDSCSYLMEADAILNGYGFNIAGMSGYVSWFSVFPIGYPLLIAAVSFITGRNLYLSSKILAILIIGGVLLLLYIRFQKNAWIYSFCLLNTGFLSTYKWSVSEIPFILGLIIFCLILDYIIENSVVKVRWFVFWGLSSVYLFLCRYFGTFSFIVIGIIFIIYFGIYIFIPQYRNYNTKAKWRGSIVAGIISGIFMVSYYMMNYLMTGTFSGTDRSEWWDEYTELTNGFYSALINEFLNASHMVLPDPITSMSRHFKIWIIVLFLMIILYLLYKYKTKDFKVVFIGVGIFYYFVFVFIRYHSSMDAFSYRFFAPASILIVIGMIGFAEKFLIRNKDKIVPIFACILVLSIMGLSATFKTFDRHNTAYSYLVTDMINVTKEIPRNSTVFMASDFDYRIRAFRPDICYVYRSIDVNDTMDGLFKRYSNSDYICIKAKYIKDMLFYPIYDYNESIVEFFRGIVTENTPDEELLVISVKNQMIQ